MRPIALERTDIHLLNDFIEKAAKWCDCGSCGLCEKREMVEKRLGGIILSGEGPHRLTLRERDVQYLVDLIDAATERHFCETPYLEAFCGLCSPRGMFERQLLALSY